MLASDDWQADAAGWAIPSPNGTWRIRASRAIGKERKGKPRFEAWIERSDGERVKLVAKAVAQHPASWSADGSKVVFGEAGSVYVAQEPAFNPVRVLKPHDEGGEGDYDYWQFTMAPDGRHVIAVGFPEGDPTHTLVETGGHLRAWHLGYCRSQDESAMFSFGSGGQLVMACTAHVGEAEVIKSCHQLSEVGWRSRPILEWISNQLVGATVATVRVHGSAVRANVIDGSQTKWSVTYNELTEKVSKEFGFQMLTGGEEFVLDRDIVALADDGTRCLDRPKTVAAAKSPEARSNNVPTTPPTRFKKPVLPVRPNTRPVAQSEVAACQDIDIEEADDAVRVLEREGIASPVAMVEAWCKFARLSTGRPFSAVAVESCRLWKAHLAVWYPFREEMVAGSKFVSRYLELQSRSLADKRLVCDDFREAFYEFRFEWEFQETLEMCEQLHLE